MKRERRNGEETKMKSTVRYRRENGEKEGDN